MTNNIGSTIYVLALIVLALGTSCSNNSKIKLARQKADQLWKDVETGNAEKDFPEKYFPRDAQFNAILTDLKGKCNFKNRKGGFVSQSYQKDAAVGTEQVAFVFDYYMACDTARFTLTYELQDSVTLRWFRIDPI